MPMRDRERLQFITFESIKMNFWKVFGTQNDAMAEMLFRYMSDCRTDLQKARVNYRQFLNKFDILWPKKPESKERKDDATIAQDEFNEKKRYDLAVNKLAFDILDIDGDGELTILDLVWLCSNFTEDNKFGKNVLDLFEVYMDKNVRPKFVQEKVSITLQVYMGEMPNIGLIEDLKYAFVKRVKQLQALKMILQEKKNKKERLLAEEEFNRDNPKHNNSFTPQAFETDEIQERRNNDFKSTQNFVSKLYNTNRLMLNSNEN